MPFAKLDALKPIARYIIMAILPAIVLCGLPLFNNYVLLTGDQVYLRVEPLDPRDLFRGDYVTLAYEVADIDKSLVEGIEPDYYETVLAYVTFTKDDSGIGRVLRVTPERPKDGLYVKAHIRGGISAYHARFGIDTYFVPEGTGRALEEAISSGEVLADVRLKNGYAVIKELSERGRVNE